MAEPLQELGDHIAQAHRRRGHDVALSAWAS